MAEKSLGDISKDFRSLFRRGQDASQRENFDYAITLFSQILDKEPACYEVRAALRAAQNGKTSGGGFFKRAFNTAASTPQLTKARMAVRNNPQEAIQIAEQILNSDPQNSTAHRIVADAALAAEMPHTAILSLEYLARHNPKDKAAVTEFAQALASIGEIQRAENVMNNLCRAFPNDPDLAKQLKNISALRTMDEGGYQAAADNQGSYRDILRNKDEAVALEQENRVQKTEDVAERLISEYQSRLQAEPNNLKLLRSIAELYAQKKQFDHSLEYYQKIKATEGGNDPSLDKAIAQTMARKFDQNIEQLDPSAPDYAEQLAKVNADKLAYQIEECRQRVEHYPTDLLIRFEMGALYFQAGKIGEAIQEFQKAQGNPHKRIAAMNYLAQCFAKRKMYDLAARTLQNAIKEKPVLDDEKKDLIYQLGCVLESMGKKEDAIEQFKLIYETDIGYRDVAAKVDAYYSGS